MNLLDINPLAFEAHKALSKNARIIVRDVTSTKIMVGRTLSATVLAVFADGDATASEVFGELGGDKKSVSGTVHNLKKQGALKIVGKQPTHSADAPIYRITELGMRRLRDK